MMRPFDLGRLNAAAGFDVPGIAPGRDTVITLRARSLVVTGVKSWRVVRCADMAWRPVVRAPEELRDTRRR